MRDLPLAFLALALVTPSLARAQNSPYLSFTTEGPGAGLSLGDVDGDGWVDFALSDPHAGSSAPDRPGRVDVLSGFDGALLHSVAGEKNEDDFGDLLASLGDVNGDGVDDYVAGAPGNNYVPGFTPYVRAHSGADGSELYRFEGAAGYTYPRALASLGDLNGDGLGDFALGGYAPGAQGGLVEVRSGVDGSLINTLTVPGSVELGAALAAYPDVDGDGSDELLVGDPGVAAVYLIAPSTGAVLRALSGPASSRFGDAIATLGDVDLDGISDVAIGAPLEVFALFTAGRVTVYSGASWTEHASVTAAPHQASYGIRVSAIGDYDQDGRADFLAAWSSTKLISGFTTAGRVQVRSGLDGTLLAEVSATANGLVPLGDLDADGVPDLMAVATSASGFPFETDVHLLGKPVPETFCYGGGSPEGCAPSISSSGTPSPTFGQELEVAGLGFPGNRRAQLFWGLGAQVPPKPFGSGLLCVAGPFKRFAATQAKGTAGACDGLALQAIPRAELQQLGWAPGTIIRLQWFGYGAGGASGFSLSDGLALTVWP